MPELHAALGQINARSAQRRHTCTNQGAAARQWYAWALEQSYLRYVEKELCFGPELALQQFDRALFGEANLLPPEWRVPNMPETALCLPTAKASIEQGVSQLSCAVTRLVKRTATLTSKQTLLKCSGLRVLLKLQASVMA